MTRSFIVPLDTREDSLEVVGGKGRSLARLANAGFDVPGGFQVTAAAYRCYVADNDLQEKILERVRPTIVNGTVSFEEASLGIGALFAERSLSAEMLAEITAAYDALADRPAVAVRSSANAEDLPDLSFAGQQETYLNVRGGKQVAQAVKKCWASLWTAQAINYRHEMSIDNKGVAMAVVVQVMVDSEVSGIAFTANPVTGERSEMIVNCSFGLSEAVVGGQVTPDTYVVDRSSLEAEQTVIGAKEQMIVADGEAGTRMVDVDAAERATASLSVESLRELAALAIRVEATFGGVPQDVEWAVASGKLWLLQSRPITNLPTQPPTEVSWPEISGSQLIKRMAAEVMPEPLSPLFEDLYLRALFDTQTWPAGWKFNGSFTRNYLKNFVIATVNGYAYTSIPVDGNEEWEAHMAELRSEQGHVPWYKTLLAAFRPTGTVIEKGRESYCCCWTSRAEGGTGSGWS